MKYLACMSGSTRSGVVLCVVGPGSVPFTLPSLHPYLSCPDIVEELRVPGRGETRQIPGRSSLTASVERARGSDGKLLVAALRPIGTEVYRSSVSSREWQIATPCAKDSRCTLKACGSASASARGDGSFHLPICQTDCHTAILPCHTTSYSTMNIAPPQIIPGPRFGMLEISHCLHLSG